MSVKRKSLRNPIVSHLLTSFGQFLQRVSAFTRNNGVLTELEFESRRAYFIEKLNSTVFLAKLQDPNLDALSQLTDGNTNEMLFNMAKSNLMGYVPQALIMGWVNYFFAGFVIMKIPFPITDGFKSMLQSGVATPDLNARYVLAISWYFANLFGLRPVYSLLMGDSAADALIQQQRQVAPPMIAPGATQVSKLFASEAENVQILVHSSKFEGIVDRVIAMNS